MPTKNFTLFNENGKTYVKSPQVSKLFNSFNVNDETRKIVEAKYLHPKSDEHIKLEGIIKMVKYSKDVSNLDMVLDLLGNVLPPCDEYDIKETKNNLYYLRNDIVNRPIRDSLISRYDEKKKEISSNISDRDNYLTLIEFIKSVEKDNNINGFKKMLMEKGMIFKHKEKNYPSVEMLKKGYMKVYLSATLTKNGDKYNFGVYYNCLVPVNKSNEIIKEVLGKEVVNI